VVAVVDKLIDAPPKVHAQVAEQAVDGGELVHRLLKSARRQPPSPPPLTIQEVSRIFEQIAEASGRGSRARKQSLLYGLLDRATDVEAKHLVKVIYQEMRHGVSEGIMLDGIAKAAGVKTSLVRRANQRWGDLGEVALVALTEGQPGLERATVRLFRPIKPMLAQPTDDLATALAHRVGRVALEYKLDGARVQIHRQGEEVRIFSRNLADVTTSLPDVVESVRDKLSAQQAILDGEAVAVDALGRPLPFQHLMRRFRRKHAVQATIEEIPVQIVLFDALYVDGETLVDLAYHARWTALEKAAGKLTLAPRLIPSDAQQAEDFARAAQRDGHEGVVAKDTDSTYNPGARGKAWLKYKHIMSLDLAIVAADWGYGRRHGWLSNYHLAARDAETGEFRVVGKTFKGLTDAGFRAMTKRLLALERGRKGGTIFVQPHVVVEVLFNEIQESSQYRSGLALRFARISRLREDKAPDEADTIQTLRELHDQQFRYKGRLP
jgi:DNA ligase-1